jgi:hypothetical protein
VISTIWKVLLANLAPSSRFVRVTRRVSSGLARVVNSVIVTLVNYFAVKKSSGEE